MLKSLWKDPVWAAVIATGITASLGSTSAYLLGYWPAVASAAISSWQFLLASTNVPNWALALLGFSATLVLFVIAAAIWERLSATAGTEANWTSYTTDSFFGMRWRWRYMNGAIDRLVTFCPHCDYQIFPQRTGEYDVLNHISFNCDSCHHHIGDFTENYEQMQSKVERFIHQKLRNGTWQL